MLRHQRNRHCHLGILTNGTAVELTVQARINVEGVFTNRVRRAGDRTRLEHGKQFRGSGDSSRVATIAGAENRGGCEYESSSHLLASFSGELPSAGHFHSKHFDRLGKMLPPPAVIGGRNRVTNDVTETTRFYRLRVDF